MTATAAQIGEAPVRWKRPSLAGLVWRVFTRRASRAIGAAIVLIFLLMAVVGPWLYPDRLPVDASNVYGGPTLAHPLGTDFEGTDVLALIVTGARYVILVAAIAAVITILIGSTIGLVSGYFLGSTDNLLMRVTDFVLTIPGFPLLVVLSTVWTFSSPWSMGLVLGVTGWGGLARAVRSQTLSLRRREFVEAMRGLGMSRRHLILSEILPNVAPYIAMNLLVLSTAFIYAEVGLFFLGVVPFTANNWGVMLNLAVTSGGALNSPDALSYLLSPLVCILLLTLGLVLCLDAVDDLFNPRLREGHVE